MLSLTVDRSGLSLGALVFSTFDTGYWLPEDGISYPAKRWRKEYVDSRNLHGSMLVRATLEQSAVAGTVYIKADTAAGLKTRRDEVEAAFGQFFYNVMIADDSGSVTYSADPADVDWGDVDSGMAAALIARASVNIPVYPIASA